MRSNAPGGIGDDGVIDIGGGLRKELGAVTEADDVARSFAGLAKEPAGESDAMLVLHRGFDVFEGFGPGFAVGNARVVGVVAEPGCDKDVRTNVVYLGAGGFGGAADFRCGFPERLFGRVDAREGLEFLLLLPQLVETRGGLGLFLPGDVEADGVFLEFRFESVDRRQILDIQRANETWSEGFTISNVIEASFGDDLYCSKATLAAKQSSCCFVNDRRM